MLKFHCLDKTSHEASLPLLAIKCIDIRIRQHRKDTREYLHGYTLSIPHGDGEVKGLQT
jgi:hypothetical protein